MESLPIHIACRCARCRESQLSCAQSPQGHRSAVIAKLLAEQAGHTKVYNVTDGIRQWLEDGHPVMK